MDEVIEAFTLPYKINNHVTILKCVWFSGRGLIGIVLVEVGSNKELKAYIANAPGHCEKADAIQVAQWGATFPLDVALKLFRM